ncbi:SusC/RagA family TonB-linked outer membrane protein [Flammeovirga agarivorans]|uniref:TonB-dependent receptor n=1 Tax=Flammeovirga agarivorans TaxID=2726742 RepID=A0A7X8SPF2_9BACT|nr:TonB-dependent receptor [Flammeovirga agarivorans]NLR93908.1 TonB-dependent receptor [Flammeovirga agarivorans]
MKRLLQLFSLLAILSLATLTSTYAQERNLTGIIYDETNSPMPGVNVIVTGTTTGTTTNFEGKFSLNVPESAETLTFSYIGYFDQSIAIGNTSNFSISMKVDAEQLEEVVIVGYGQMEKKDVTGAMSSVKSEDFNQGVLTSPDQLIQGKIAGVQMTPSSGEPGAGVNIRVRGGTSLTASNEPLYVIDGFPIDNTASDPGTAGVYSASASKNPLASINPADIESFDILKDASATAIYGARGANGVIIITTKKGKEGQAKVNYDAYVGISNIAKKLDVLTASEYRAATQAEGSTPLDLDANTDWQEVMTRQAITQNHNLGVSGGTANTQYRFSVNYLNQDGIMINSGMERIGGRMNITQKLSKKVTLGANMMGSFTKNNNLPYGVGGALDGGVINNMIRMSPLLPQDYSSPNLLEKNPYIMANSVRDFTNTQRVLGNAYVEAEFVEGLTGKINIGGDITSAKRNAYLPGSIEWVGEGNGSADVRNNFLHNVLLEGTLNYTKTFGDVKLNALAGYTFQEFGREYNGANATGFQIDDIAEYNLNAASGDNILVDSYKESSKLISWIGRANLSFKDKYVFTGTMRVDGSSRFGDNNKWGVFPSVSGAWRISEELFLSGSDVLSDLKLRAGWGITGSQEIGNYRSLPTLSGDKSYGAVGIGAGVTYDNYANPDLKWEETSQLNIGLDFEFFNGILFGTIDAYQKHTKDLLLELQAPQPAPVDVYLQNVGELKNHGIEISLNTVNFSKDNFTWQTGVVAAFNKNEVENIGDYEEIFTGAVGGRGQVGQFAQVIKPGLPYGTFYGPRFEGLDESGNAIESEESYVLGQALPKWTLGINNSMTFGRFDLNFFFNGSFGHQVFNNTALEFSSTNDLYGDQSTYNVMKSAAEEDIRATKYNSKFIEDASFLRLSNMTLGYTFNMSNVKSVSRLRLYVSGQNLFVITNYSGYDPEVNAPAGGSQVPPIGIDYNNYPAARTFMGGVSVEF